MININLLIKPPPPVRWRLMIGIAIIGGLLGTSGIAVYAALTNVQKLDQQLAHTRQLMDDYTRIGKQLPEIQSQVEQAQSQLGLLAQIDRNQRHSQAVVARTLLDTPPALWITSITFSADEVTLSGQSSSFDSAMQYLAGLRASPLVQKVTEKSLKTIDSGATAFTYLVQLRGEVKP